jgi:hypothetical protein
MLYPLSYGGGIDKTAGQTVCSERTFGPFATWKLRLTAILTV